MICSFLIWICLLSLLVKQAISVDVEVIAEPDSFFGSDSNEEFPQSDFTQEIALDYDPVLLRAASNGDLQLVQEFLRDGHPIDEKNDNGWTALTFAVANNFEDIVRELIRSGADVNSFENDGWTPLMFAAFQGNWRLSEILVDVNSDLNHQNSRDLTAHDLARLEGHDDLANYLGEQSIFYSIRSENPRGAVYHIRNGINANIPNPNGWSALMLASALGDVDSVRDLLELGADVNQQERDGWTPLLFAANNGHALVVDILLKSGAEKLHISLNNHTAHSRALERGQEEVIAVLDAFDPQRDSHPTFEDIIRAHYEQKDLREQEEHDERSRANDESNNANNEESTSQPTNDNLIEDSSSAASIKEQEPSSTDSKDNDRRKNKGFFFWNNN